MNTGQLFKLFVNTLLIFMFLNVKGQNHYNENEKNHHHKLEDKHHHSHHNHLGLSLSSTSNLDHHTTGFTIGLDYEYRFSVMYDLIGIGLLSEYVFVESGEIILGLPVFIHLNKYLKFNIAALYVSAESHETYDPELSDSQAKQSSRKMENYFGARFGAGSNFHVGNFCFGPAINFDLTNTSAVNYGVTIGYGF